MNLRPRCSWRKNCLESSSRALNWDSGEALGTGIALEGLKKEMIIINGGKLPKEGISVPEQARSDNRVGGRRWQNHESSWLKPRCKGKGLCSPSNDPGSMPDHWPFMEPTHARPWAKCWDHHQCYRASHPP